MTPPIISVDTGVELASTTRSHFVVRDVWAHTLYQDFRDMLELAKNYRIIAIDTEFPGTIVDVPCADSHQPNYLNYKNVVSNVNLLKLIQIGFSFFNEYGERPTPCNTWQYNFKFNTSLDMGGFESLKMLKDNGFDFNKHRFDGIDHLAFAELLYTSDLIMNPDTIWVTFHGSYDICYLVKILMNSHLPHSEEKVFPYFNYFFPRLYDLKVLANHVQNLPNGLQAICDNCEVTREGTAHHAGSDSSITGKLFFRMLELFFENIISNEKYLGQLHGFRYNKACEALKNFVGESKYGECFVVKKRE